MDVRDRAYQKLIANLEDLTKLYRQLLDIVRKEKEILLAANLDELNANNQGKEALLMKLRMVDVLRVKHAEELAAMVGADKQNPRLLEIAQKMGGPEGDRLRSLHSALEMVIQRMMEINRENEEYARSALDTLQGALGEIKDTLGGNKKIYAKKGTYQPGPDQTGNFVRKEA